MHLSVLHVCPMQWKQVNEMTPVSAHATGAFLEFFLVLMIDRYTKDGTEHEINAREKSEI